MARKSELLQRIWHHYEDQRGHRPTSAREAVEWGVAEGVLDLPDIDLYDVLAGQMASALREEIQRVVPESRTVRRYRVNHLPDIAVRVSRGGVQYTFLGKHGVRSA